jgi:hypothetical protein
VLPCHALHPPVSLCAADARRYYTSRKAYDSKPGTPSGGVELSDIVSVVAMDVLQFSVCAGVMCVVPPTSCCNVNGCPPGRLGAGQSPAHTCGCCRGFSPPSSHRCGRVGVT